MSSFKKSNWQLDYFEEMSSKSKKLCIRNHEEYFWNGYGACLAHSKPVFYLKYPIFLRVLGIIQGVEKIQKEKMLGKGNWVNMFLFHESSTKEIFLNAIKWEKVKREQSFMFSKTNKIY